MADAVFAYGSLAGPSSAALTLGRPVEIAALASLDGWRRRWTLARDNLACEKTFARADDGSLPPWCAGLTLERAGAGEAAPNGALIEVDEGDLARLDARELRYDRTDVSAAVRIDGDAGFDRVLAYVAKPAHHHPRLPAGAVIISSYLRAVEAAFAELGYDQLELFRRTTGDHPAPVVEAVLVRDRIPVGNPRDW